MRFCLSDNLHSLLTAEVCVTSRGAEHAERIDSCVNETSNNASKSGFINDVMIERSQRKSAEASKHFIPTY